MIKTNKEYKIYKLVNGTAKNGIHYTICKIKENVKDDSAVGGWKQYYYKVFLPVDCPDARENGLILFKSIEGVQMRNTSYNGKSDVECTIYPNKDSVFFKDTEDSLKDERVNANPWKDDDLPF